MKKYLQRISAACGIADPAEACRVILKIVEEAEGTIDKINEGTVEDKINVKVSGSDVYKAVSNYFHHSGEIQYKITKAIDHFLSRDMIEDALRKALFAHFFSNRNLFEREVEEIVKKEVRKTIKEELKISEDMIKNTVGNTLKKMLMDK